MLAFRSPLQILNGSMAATSNYDDIVRGQLLDALTTNQGERVMHPTWGCNIQQRLYDPASSLERNDVAAQIRNLLVHMVPRALILSVSVQVSDEEPNKVYIDLVYKASSYSPASSMSVAVDTTSNESIAAGVGA